MKKPARAGLIAAGPVSSALPRLAGLSRALGPVCSATLRVASRLANNLKSGYPARTEELAGANPWLLSGPEEAMPRLIEIALNSVPAGRAVVLLDAVCESGELVALRRAGAYVATANSLHAFPDSRFVMEGDSRALLRLKRFLQVAGGTAYTLEPGKKHMFTAGLAFTTTLCTPLAAAASECLRRSGLDAASSTRIVERSLQQTIRAWMKSGRQGWSGHLAAHDLDAVRRQLEALGAESAILSAYFAETARLALHVFGRDAEWLRALAEESPGEEL